MCRSRELFLGDIDLHPFNPDSKEPHVISQAEIFRSLGAFEIQAQQVPATQYFNRDGQRVFTWLRVAHYECADWLLIEREGNRLVFDNARNQEWRGPKSKDARFYLAQLKFDCRAPGEGPTS